MLMKLFNSINSYNIIKNFLQILSNMCKQGFDDALRFLHRNNLLNCTRCLAVQSTFVVSETLDDNMDYDPECLECKMHRQVHNIKYIILIIFISYKQ